MRTCSVLHTHAMIEPSKQLRLPTFKKKKQKKGQCMALDMNNIIMIELGRGGGLPTRPRLQLNLLTYVQLAN